MTYPDGVAVPRYAASRASFSASASGSMDAGASSSAGRGGVETALAAAHAARSSDIDGDRSSRAAPVPATGSWADMGAS
ncbi:hypothetical protein [Streptomyces rugosispiralis]|uniref:Uncharacterized protein n=1 Tax=Streptomyces rugosispiralis TaxID=2967341 RepID=A0ABT1V7Q9_9ACTN|nr:hypothetical protein [Streptomyces rugosispiralis]MCQ8193415.1 hypothetical protein [Streptomyces rugosispiralis]